MLIAPWAKGILTMLPSKFDSAVAATIGVSLCRRTATVMAAIATVIKGQRDAEDIETRAHIADDNGNTAERHEASRHSLPPRGLPKPNPGEGGGGERAGCDDDRDIRYAGQLQAPG